MDTTVITELAEYYEKELKYHIPDRTPFVGKNFNATRAGIHADGLLKDQEIYNIFDTEKILHKPPTVIVDSFSGLAGIAFWINKYYNHIQNCNEKTNHKHLTIYKIKTN